MSSHQGVTRIWWEGTHSVRDTPPPKPVSRITVFSIRAASYFQPPKILELILDSSLSTTPHIQPINKSYWLHFENILRIQSPPLLLAFSNSPSSLKPDYHSHLWIDFPESDPTLLKSVLTQPADDLCKTYIR